MSSCIRDWKCIIVANISLEYKITNQNSSFWISLTSHFVALSQKSMKVAFFQRFVEYNRPTWNRIVRHIVCHTQSEGARRVSDSSTRISERGFPIPCLFRMKKMISPCRPWRNIPVSTKSKKIWHNVLCYGSVLTGMIEMSNFQC